MEPIPLKISQLPAADPLVGSELFEVSQIVEGEMDSRQVTMAEMADYFGTAIDFEWGDGTGAPATAIRFQRPNGTWSAWVDLVGPQGVQGPKGPKGDTGARGAQGIQGPKGDKGDKGDQGVQGDQGLKGDTGDQGIQGPKGDTGSRGPQGLTGPAPNSQWGNGSSYPVTAIRFQQADGSWGPYTNLKGDQGVQGVQGPKGDKGDTGNPGPKGDQGDQGIQGVQGVKGDAPAHSWSGYSVRFQNPNGSWGAYQNLRGEPGPKGNTGAQGIQGPKGDKGDTGAQGIQGIQGPKGDKGDQGIQGEPGPSEWSGVTGKPDEATRWPAWGEVTNKPDLAPAQHAHDRIDAMPHYSAPFNDASLPPRDFHDAGVCSVFVRSTFGWPIGYGCVLNIPSYTRTQDGGAMQIISPYSQSYTAGGHFMWRIGKYNNSGWTDWHTAVSKEDLDAQIAALDNSLTQAIATKLNASSFTAAAVLSLLQGNAGPGSGLDADTVDGYEAADFLRVSQNGSDVQNKAAFRTSLGLGSAATENTGAFATAAQGDKADGALQAAQNGSDIPSKSSFRAALGLGSAATSNTGDFATATQGSKADGAMQKAQNGSDIPNKPSFRSALGLGTAATANTSAFATAAQGTKADGALQKGQNGADIPDKQAFIANLGISAGSLEYATFMHTSAAGGQNGSSGAWRTRPVDVIDTNIAGAALANNTITLPAGTYILSGWGHFWRTEASMIRAYDVTNGVVLADGSYQQTDHNTAGYSITVSVNSWISWTTITVQPGAQIEFQYYISRGGPIGLNSSVQETSVYGALTFLRV